LDVHVISKHDAAGRDSYPPRRVPVVSPLAAEIPRAWLTAAPWNPGEAPRNQQTPTLFCDREIREGSGEMSEEAEKARQALQESMDLREQGHSDD
jgi:hypothetical protein